MPPRPSALLERGDLPPEVLVPPPGPRSRELSRRLAAAEAPGVNTLGPSPGPGDPGAVSLIWDEALGANVLDVDGNRFVDLTSGFGVAAVGHRHPRVVEAAARQAGRLLHGMGDVAAHPSRIELAERLGAVASVRGAAAERRVHFAVSGADAVEIALKTALLATRRPGVIAFDPSYHGVTLGALAATSRPAFRGPFQPHLHPHVHRLNYASSPDRIAELVGRESIAAVLLEPVVGREGVIPPPPGWLPQIADLCSEHGVLLVADEIFTGFGRTGDLFAVDHEGVRPDLLCCGKALGGGLPIAATLGRGELMDHWTPGARGGGGVEALHTATHLANPPACAAALAVLDLLDELELPARARRLGEAIASRLRPWPDRFDAIRRVRGRGLLWGIEFATAEAAKATASDLMQRGVLALAGGPDGTVLQIVPPLTITEEQLDVALDLLEETLQ